jgi:hypothetical protein
VTGSLRRMKDTHKTWNARQNIGHLHMSLYRLLTHPYRFISHANITHPTAIILTAFDREGQSSFDSLPPVLFNKALTLFISCILTKSFIHDINECTTDTEKYTLISLVHVTSRMENTTHHAGTRSIEERRQN